MTRELTDTEDHAASRLCAARTNADATHSPNDACDECRAYIVAGVDASPSEATIIEQVNAERIAGMLSTLDFRPAERHPSECVPMAKAVLAEIMKNLPLYSASHAGDGVPRVTELEIEELDERLANANPIYRKTILDALSYCAKRQEEWKSNVCAKCGKRTDKIDYNWLTDPEQLTLDDMCYCAPTPSTQGPK